MPPASPLGSRNTAGIPAPRAHFCAVEAGTAVIVAVANPELVAYRLRCSADTVDRMVRSDSPAQWTWPRLVALAALERDALGTSTLADALQAPFQGAPMASNDVNGAGKSVWCAAEDLAHEMAEDLMTGGGLDLVEIRRLQRKSACLRAALDTYDAAALAALQHGVRA